MLNLGHLNSRNCQYSSRRELLQVGACGALGLSLPQWFAARAAADSASSGPASPVKAKSVLLLWMWGGPSHHEMWDPKPEAPLTIRGPYRPIDTSASGMQISELLPMTAQTARRFCIVRSMAHDQSDHNVGGTVSLTGTKNGAKASGAVPFPGRVRPSLGSLVSYLGRERGSDWPSFTAIGPECVVSGAPLLGQDANVLGAAHDPFRLQGWTENGGLTLPSSLQPLGDIGAPRLDNRRDVLSRLEGWQRQIEASGQIDRYSEVRQKAFGLISSAGAKAALNLEAESETLRDRYGRTVFGQNCILARRLVETGVPFVQVNWSGDAEDEQQGGDGGWDLHYRLFERMQDRYCPVFDLAFSALLEDLDQRGLLDTTLVLAMGEFGRSPKISSIGGREHWPFGYSIVAAGAGTPGGAVIGSTTFDGGFPAERPNHPVDLIATVLQKMGLSREELFAKDASVLGAPIPELDT
jgi:hypothetical protein